MTEEERKEQKDIDAEFKNMFFNVLKDAGEDVSMDENGFIVIPYKRRKKKQGKETDENA